MLKRVTEVRLCWWRSGGESVAKSVPHAGSVLAALLLVPLCGRAATLAELTAGGSLETSSLAFDLFSFTGYAGGPTADQVAVTTVIRPDGSHGLRFEGAFQSSAPASASISYRVTAKGEDVLLA